jgi:prepilin-type N-terminal cleavage/methylation domain-containing protein
MRRGFTLLELIVVIIIIGVLATLGIQQYTRAIERSRGAEARQIVGQIRTEAAAFRLQNGNDCTGFNATPAGIGTNVDQIPSACRGTHYFSYAVSGAGTDAVTLTATRCTASGKTPQASTAFTLVLTSDMSSGADTWAGTGGY